MESVLLVDRLKQAIEDDFKGIREELDKAKQEKQQLEDQNDFLNKQNKELRDDNISLTKTLKELKEKNDRLHEKLKRKQDEIKKKAQWWDRYRYTAETTIKKLRTQGSFAPDVLHEVSRDLVDIMDEASNKESNSSHSSQENEVKNSSKLKISKDGKKRVRYTEISPETNSNNGPVRLESKSTGNDDSYPKKQDNIVPAAHSKVITGDKVNMTGRKPENDLKNILGSKKHRTEDTRTLVSKKLGQNKENDKQISVKKMKKSYVEDENNLDDDETYGYPSLLTSTPMFSTSNKEAFLTGAALNDISIIHKDKEKSKSPNEIIDSDNNHDDVDCSSPLTPAVPTIFENLLTRRTSNSTLAVNGKNNEENAMSTNENTRTGNKEMKIMISDIQKFKSTDKDGTSPSILRNVEFGAGGEDDTVDYPVIAEDHVGSPSILGEDIGPVKEGDRDLCTRSGSGMKRKRDSLEEKDDKQDTNNKANPFKMPVKPPHCPSINKQPKDPRPSECDSVVLLSDDEDDGNKIDSSSVDMFANSSKSSPKDLSNDVKDVTSVREEDQSSKTAQTSKSQYALKNLDLIKQDDVDDDLLNEEFPGFRKPDELNYKNIEVVRKKDERAKLNGFSCRDCEKYYGKMTEEERKKKLKHCSRHRAKYSPPPSTPPGFWNLSFPSTQEVIDGGMMVVGDKAPVQKPRRLRKKRLLKGIPKKP